MINTILLLISVITVIFCVSALHFLLKKEPKKNKKPFNMNKEKKSLTEREKHLDWSKQRAFEILDRGDYVGAYTSFANDMKKHEETANHSALELGIVLIMSNHITDVESMRKHIEGFN